MPYTLTDSHAHLYSEQFDDDRDEMVQHALDKQVTRLFLPNIDSTSILPMLDLVNKYPDNCFPMMGLHPCSVQENYQEELAIVQRWLFEKKSDDKKFVAVGEIGLDYYWDKTFIERQKDALRQQIQWAKELGLPVVLHSRDSFDDLYHIVKEEKDERLNGIFHCFTGSLDDAQKIMDIGFYMGIGGVVTFKNSKLDEVVKEIPMEYLVLETDSPYLTPAPHRGKRNESAYIKLIADKISEIKSLAVDEIAEITTENTKSVFRL